MLFRSPGKYAGSVGMQEVAELRVLSDEGVRQRWTELGWAMPGYSLAVRDKDRTLY